MLHQIFHQWPKLYIIRYITLVAQLNIIWICLGFSINSFTGLRVISIFSLIIITIIIVIVVLVHNKSESSASFFSYKFASASNTQSPLDIYAAYKYIIDRYNPSYGLVSENEHINKYWLWSDNLLAAQVLKGHNHDLSENISSTIKKYIQKYNIEIRSAWASLIDDPALITRIQTSFLLMQARIFMTTFGTRIMTAMKN